MVGADPQQEPTRSGGPDASSATTLNLKQVALQLDVHYMTAYRYVRSGRLRARRDGTAWVVEQADVDALRSSSAASPSSEPRDRPAPGAETTSVDWAGRLHRYLAVGDETGAWSTVQAALVAGWEPEDVLVALISDAVRRTDSDADPAASHLAVTTATRTVGLVASQFRRRGRSRGTVVLGSPSGEGHTLGLAIVADVLRLRNFQVLDLGSSVGPEAFVGAARLADRLVAVALGVTDLACLDSVRPVADAIRRDIGDVPVVVGGRAVANPEVAALSGGSAWASDAASMATLIESLRHRPTPTAPRRALATDHGR